MSDSKQIIRKIMESAPIQQEPPVLIDIGASGEINPIWKLIAPYSICIAFDADSRDFNVSETENRGYKKLYTFNSLVGTKEAEKSDFYLTTSPHCSSILEPETDKLKDYYFSNLFAIEKTITLNTTTIESCLDKLGLNRIDWYKSDTQGIDLRIFSHLPDSIREKILVADFEPGIINAYKKEDKLYSLMEFMNRLDFWPSKMNIKGSVRIPYNLGKEINLKDKEFLHSHKLAPGWCEITYINSFVSNSFSLRDALLLSVFSILNNEYGFALYVVNSSRRKYKDAILNELENHLIALIRKPVPLKRKIINKISYYLSKI